MGTEGDSVPTVNTESNHKPSQELPTRVAERNRECIAARPGCIWFCTLRRPRRLAARRTIFLVRNGVPLSGCHRQVQRCAFCDFESMETLPNVNREATRDRIRSEL